MNAHGVSAAALACGVWALGLSTPAFAQVGDDCAAPIAIAGLGRVPFDLTTATTGAQGQSEPLCNDFNLPGLTNDVWYTWTAPATGRLAITNCGYAAIDSKIAVYEGTGCPTASALVCNDNDFCSGPSRLEFPCVAGRTYTLQLGLHPGALPASGYLMMQLAPLPVVVATVTNPATGVQYSLLSQSGWHAAEAAARNLGGHLATIGDAAEQAWVHQTFSSYANQQRNLWLGYSDELLEGSFVWTSGELGGYTNFTGAGADNYGGVENWVHTVAAQGGAWNDNTSTVNNWGLVEFPNPAYAAFCLGDGSAAACPCGNQAPTGTTGGCMNSLNSSARLSAQGTASVSLVADTLRLVGTGMPNAPALYFQGTTQQSAGVGVAFGDGLRCAGGTIVRLATKANAAGVSFYPGAGEQPVSVRGLVLAPGTRTYQVWYRNSAAFCTAATFNLTNGLQVLWQ